MFTVFALIVLRDLFAIIMLTGIFSLVAASLFVVLDAADVAFTEAAVGAGIATLLMLKTLALTERHASSPPWRPWLAGTVVMVAGGLLLYGTWDLPAFGSADAPAQQIGLTYTERSYADTGIPNMVTSILASYRGFDTLGELVVILIACVGVLALLGGSGEPPARQFVMRHHMILRVVAKMLIPLVLLFALYVQFHGEYGPGGGFQAGVIFASAFVLYTMLFGSEPAEKVAGPITTRVLAALGVLIFAGAGVVSILFGGAFLEYGVWLDDTVTAQQYGIIVIELGVGITVAASMIRIYFEFDNMAAVEEVNQQ